MKDIIDVMNFQMDSMNSKLGNKTVLTDYKRRDGKGLTARFLFECSIKLNMKPLTSAMAAILFHKFYKEVETPEYDSHMIAASCLYLASKIKDDSIKIRDIINVAHNTLNRGAPPLELSDEYWMMRDTIVQAELLITRVLKFDLNTVHPHKYMLHYMKTLQDWFGQNEWNRLPIATAAATYLQDFHHSPSIIEYKPSHIAICCLSLAFQTYGVTVPLADDNEEGVLWYSAFVEDLNREKHWDIMEKIMEVYNREHELDEK